MSRDSGLLIIDVQVGIIEGFHAYHGAEVLEQINKLRLRARASNIPIICTTAKRGILSKSALTDGRFIRKSGLTTKT